MTERSGVMVRDFMHRNLEVVPPETTIVKAAVRMREKRLGSLLVVPTDARGHVFYRSGIVTETDLVRKVIAANFPTGSTGIGAMMNAPLIHIDINHAVRDASRLMAEKRIRHLAVAEDGKIVGLLSVRDLVKMVSVRDGPRFLHST